MSVRTKAEEQTDFARKYIVDSISCLNEILVNDCWGSEGLTMDYKRDL